MTAQFEEDAVIQPMGYDPFPQPQTIPAGWDVSVLSNELETAGPVDDLAETDPPLMKPRK